MIELNRVTIICADCYNYGKAVAALQKCNEHVKAVRTILLTDIPLNIDGIEIVQIPTIKDKADYSRFIIKELYKYFDTEFVLIVQHDGYILNYDCWNDEFYNFDYTGASWTYEHGRNVGNGGFSLRSKKLQTILGNDDLIEITGHEDQTICIIYGEYLTEKYGIKFATENVADSFSFELKEPLDKTFGFHGYFHAPYQKTVVIKRTGALGDVIDVEPVLRYYFHKGYRIIIDTLPQFYFYFARHTFPIGYIDNFNRKIKHEFYNLDMAYEVNPKQLHVKSYFDFCGIKEPYYKIPHLNFPLKEEEVLFKQKYAVIHIDSRPQLSRNIYGIDWKGITSYLKSKGYLVIQVGLNEHEDIGGIEFRTINENMIMYAMAGCDLFIGIDSGVAHIATAFSKKSIIFFGSVNPSYIYYDFNKTIPIHNHKEKVCDKPFCWSETIGSTTGTPCYLDVPIPPCVQFKNSQLINAINEII